MARLINLNELFTTNMGRLLPPDLTLSGSKRVLDVACGPGGWALQVAFAQPELEVVGIDISQQMIEYAHTLATAQHLENVTFRVMNATEPLDFPENTFDVVNARFLFGFMPSSAWLPLAKEFVRIARPGGTIHWTEIDGGGMTNSRAFERLDSLFAQAQRLDGRGFSIDGRHYGITPLLGQFLANAGCKNIREQAHVLNFSAGADGHYRMVENYKIAMQLLRPFVIGKGVSTLEEQEQLYQQMLLHMYSPDFRALLYYLSVWGQKPVS